MKPDFDALSKKSRKSSKSADVELIFCCKVGCDEPAYFWCNRNKCDRVYCDRLKRFKIWYGCNQAVCWKHFKFEYYIDRENDNAEQKVIVNWHCIGRNKGGQNDECTQRRQQRNCGCLCLIMAPMWIVVLVFVLASLGYYFKFTLF